MKHYLGYEEKHRNNRSFIALGDCSAFVGVCLVARQLDCAYRWLIRLIRSCCKLVHFVSAPRQKQLPH